MIMFRKQHKLVKPCYSTFSDKIKILENIMTLKQSSVTLNKYYDNNDFGEISYLNKIRFKLYLLDVSHYFFHSDSRFH